MEPPVRGPFGPPIRDPDEEREIDEHPGALEEGEGEPANTRNDTAVHAADMPVHDRAAHEAANEADEIALTRSEGDNYPERADHAAHDGELTDADEDLDS
jgi:hypothetical protein